MTLNKLLELARNYVMTKEDKQVQICSFAYGNTHFENESITKEDIEQAMKKLKEAS